MSDDRPPILSYHRPRGWIRRRRGWNYWSGIIVCVLVGGLVGTYFIVLIVVRLLHQFDF